MNKLYQILDTLMMEQEGTHCDNPKPYAEEIKQLFQDLIEEVIGEEEIGEYSRSYYKNKNITDNNIVWFARWAEVVAQNKLKARQREIAKELLEKL
jgi:hypothetical protein